jgi:hypothetical protein
MTLSDILPVAGVAVTALAALLACVRWYITHQRKILERLVRDREQKFLDRKGAAARAGA